MEGSASYRISGVADWKVFDSVADLLARELKGSWTAKLDGVEQRYWDLEVGTITITLHLEQSLGIFLIGENSTDSTYQQAIQVIETSRLT